MCGAADAPKPSLVSAWLRKSFAEEMSENAIEIEQLGKSYLIGHQGRRAGYQSLRDIAAETAKNFLRSGVRTLRGQTAVTGQEIEELWALNDVSFKVKQGEVIGIIGRNGAGKSTLLKVLSRITEPTRGRVTLRGRVASLLEVGTGFHPELSGRENIYLNGSILGMSRSDIKQKFDEIVAFAEVERFLDTPVKRYSSGMYVRLAFAVAAHLEPEILIVDEVLAVGDAQFQKKCMGKMKDVSSGGRTVLLVSHTMTTIVALCPRAILLDAGRVAFDGPSTDAVQRYTGSGDASLGEITWDNPRTAPGNDNVRIRAVRIISDDQVTDQVDISKETTIEIDYSVLREGLAISISFHLLDEWDSPILATGNSPSASTVRDPWFGRSFPSGDYRTRCRIPRDFLNNRNYRVSVFVLRDMTTVEARIDSVIGFTVQDSPEMRQEYLGPWIGAIRPKLPWQTEQILSSQPSDSIATLEQIR